MAQTTIKRQLIKLQKDINKSPFKTWFIAKQCGFKKPTTFCNILAGRRRPPRNDYSFIETAYKLINQPINLN